MKKAGRMILTLGLLCCGLTACGKDAELRDHDTSRDIAMSVAALAKPRNADLNRHGDPVAQWTETAKRSGPTALTTIPATPEDAERSAQAAPVASEPGIDWAAYEADAVESRGNIALLRRTEDGIRYLYPDLSLETILDRTPAAVYVYFDASRSGIRKEVSRLFEDMALRYEHVLFIVADADRLPEETLSRYTIRDLPRCIVFRDGKIMHQVKGYHSGFSGVIEQALLEFTE